MVILGKYNLYLGFIAHVTACCGMTQFTFLEDLMSCGVGSG